MSEIVGSWGGQRMARRRAASCILADLISSLTSGLSDLVSMEGCDRTSRGHVFGCETAPRTAVAGGETALCIFEQVLVLGELRLRISGIGRTVPAERARQHASLAEIMLPIRTDNRLNRHR